MFNRIVVALIGSATLTYGYCGVAQATPITFDFAGPTSSVGGEDFVKGSITFETNISPIDVRGNGDQGERLLYKNSILDFSFTAGNISRTFSSGDVQLWNDYSFSTGNSLIKEPDTIRFDIDGSSVLAGPGAGVSLIVTGIDQSLLNSGELPLMLPSNEKIFRIDFFANEGQDEAPNSYSFASNSIQIVRKQSVHESDSIIGMFALGALVVSFKRKNKLTFVSSKS